MNLIQFSIADMYIILQDKRFMFILAAVHNKNKEKTK